MISLFAQTLVNSLWLESCSQHPMVCATKFPALGDDMKYGTVSPISIPRIEAIANGAMLLSCLAATDPNCKREIRINQQYFQIPLQLPRREKLKEPMESEKYVRICMNFEKERTRDTNNMFRTCLRCHKLGLQKVFEISHC